MYNEAYKRQLWEKQNSEKNLKKIVVCKHLQKHLFLIFHKSYFER